MGILGAFVVPHPPLIIPEVGKGQERGIQKTIDAYQTVAERIGELCPETIVMISSHQVMYANYFHVSPGEGAKGDFGRFGIGQVSFSVAYDTEFVRQFTSLAQEEKLPAGTDGETDCQLDHGTMVPLYFVNQQWNQYRLVRIGLSGLSLMKHYEVGQCIQKAAERLGRKIVVIASGDLSHCLKEDGPYGFKKEGPEYDRQVMDALKKGDFGSLLDFPEELCNKAGECGHRTLVMMAGTLDRMRAKVRCLSYEGPFGVGYGVCEYISEGRQPDRNFKELHEEKERARVREQIEKQDTYVALARRTIDEYARTGKVLEAPKGLLEEMYQKRGGVFVSIKENGSLRGCIGTIEPAEASLALEIIHNAISASARDPRFSPIEPEELDRLTITVDVIGPVEPVDSPDKLDVKRYGIIVSREGNRGLLLPDLDGVDTVQEQIEIAKRKAGIGENEEVALERFEVERHF